MNEQNKKWKRSTDQTLILLAVALLLFLPLASLSVSSTKPHFINIWDGREFNVSQDQNEVFFVLANDTDGDYPLNFTHNAYDPSIGFYVFSMTGYNDTSALINFTPRNDDVGNYTFVIIVTDNASEYTTAQVTYHIINVNDPPNITEYYPSDLNPVTVENVSLGFRFNYSATDPDIQWGDTLSSRWYKDGIVVAENETNFTFSPGFCDAGVYNITVIVTDSFNASSSVSWNLTVNNSNRPPVFNKTIGNRTWPEDNNLLNNFTLWDHFYDPDNIECTGDNMDNLTFSVTGNTHITIGINDGNVSFTPDSNWNGIETVVFHASDGEDSASSNSVVLNVTPVNDPPVLGAIGNESVWANVIFTMQLNATDPDTVDGDILTFNRTILTGSIPEFSMTDEGLINFTPVTVGNSTINFTVTDSSGALDYEVVSFEIKNNSAPVISSPPIVNCTQESYCEINITGIDPDNDDINYSSNYTSLNVTKVNSSFARFHFIPHNDDVGNHTVLFRGEDAKGAYGENTTFMVVVNVNDPPVLDPIGSLIANVNKTFFKWITASDPDNNYLNFTTNSTLFNITDFNATGAYINFTPTEEEKGTYSILFSVTDGQLSDSETVSLDVTYNHDPVINNISDQNATTYTLWQTIVSGSDPDGDDLTFTTNWTRISVELINSTASRLYMTPVRDERGLHNITVFAHDGYGGTANTSFLLNITHINNAPYFDPEPTNATFILNKPGYFYLTARDIDGDNLTFGSNYSFAITNMNSTTARYESTFTSTGNITILVNVTDDIDTDEAVMNIFVRTNNSAPNITGYYPSQRFSVTELDNVTFNATVFDADGDYIYYHWYLSMRNTTADEECSQLNQSYCNESCTWNGSSCLALNPALNWVLESEEENYTLATNYSSAGNYTVKLLVNDPFDGNDTRIWRFDIDNLNRQPIFGKKEIGVYDSTFKGTFTNTELNNGVIRLKYLSNHFETYGLFDSESIDFKEGERLYFTTMDYRYAVPVGGSVVVYTRSSPNNSTWTAYEPVKSSGAEIPSSDARFLQFRLEMHSPNSSVSPNVTYVAIHYIIANYTMTENTIVSNWIDLDDFFTDYDGQSELSFNSTGNSKITVDIDEVEHTVNLIPADNYVGSENIKFVASDGNGTVYSNEATVTVNKYPQQTIATPSSGGGGGGTKVIEKEIIRNLKKNTAIVSLNILHPGKVTLTNNMTVRIPITLLNTRNITIKGLTLTADANNKNIKAFFSESYFDELKGGEALRTMLTIKADRVYGDYDIIINATSREPAYSDTTKILISSIERGETNRTQINTRLSFTRDLLKENPECLELNEQIGKAEEMIRSGNYTEAGALLMNIQDACRYLISAKEKIEKNAVREEPLNVKINQGIARYKGLLAAAIATLIGAVMIVLGMHVKRIKRRKH